MTFEYAGFNGPMLETRYAILAGRFYGIKHAVGGPNDFRVTAVTNADRTVRALATGAVASAHGALVISDADVVFPQSEPVPAGTSRWDTIALEFDWRPTSSPGGVVTPIVMKGTTAQAISTTNRTNLPGERWTFPLALVLYNGTSSQPVSIIDLRVRAQHGGPFVDDGVAQNVLDAAGYDGGEYAICGWPTDPSLVGGATPRVVQRSLNRSRPGDWLKRTWRNGNNAFDLVPFLGTTGVGDFNIGASGRLIMGAIRLDDPGVPYDPGVRWVCQVHAHLDVMNLGGDTATRWALSAYLSPSSVFTAGSPGLIFLANKVTHGGSADWDHLEINGNGAAGPAVTGPQYLHFVLSRAQGAATRVRFGSYRDIEVVQIAAPPA